MRLPHPQGPASWRLLEAVSLLWVELPLAWAGPSPKCMAVVASCMGTMGTREPADNSCDVVLVLGEAAAEAFVVWKTVAVGLEFRSSGNSNKISLIS